MAEELFRNILLRSQKSKALVEVYSDFEDPGKFAAGFVQSVSDCDFTLGHISPDGDTDGSLVLPISAVIRINEDTRYLRRLSLLLKKRPSVTARKPRRSRPDPANCFIEELQRAMQNREIVSFQIVAVDVPQTNVTGFVRKVTDSYVQIAELNEDGEPDGMSTVKIDTICQLSRNGLDERQIALFYRNRRKLYKESK